MLPKNVINSEKKGKITGTVFHLFYMDMNTSVLFDSNLSIPIIWGSKSIIITLLKNITREMPMATEDTKVIIYSYILGSEGYRRIQTFNAPISEIGKYLIRY